MYPDGKVTVDTGCNVTAKVTRPHRATFADELGVPPEDIVVRHGNTVMRPVG